MDCNVKSDLQIGVECFVNANKKYWANDLGTTGEDGWIYVLHTLHSEFTVSLVEDIVAKGIQAKEHLPIVSVISGRADEMMGLMDVVDASFGIEQRFHPSYHDYHNEEIENLAAKMATKTYGDKDGLIGLAYRGVRFGDALYDDIIRGGSGRNRGKIFNCFEISRERYCAFIRNALAIIDQAYELFEEKRPRYLITTEYFYTKALYAHVANVLGAKILLTFGDCPDVIVQVDPGKYKLSEIKYADLIRIEMEKCLQRKLIDDTYDEDLFVLSEDDEKVIEHPSWCSKRKNVFILPHAFGDSPREACRHNIYHDYLEWFLDTMRIIKGITDVNWIIKDHPWAHYYKQESYVKAIFENNKAENIYLIDKDLAGINIKDYADCVLTCTGDAGIEYWAYGVPTITVGNAYYCNWGISYQMRTLSEYENTLKNMHNLNAPSKQSMELAKKYLTAWKCRYKYGDAFSKLIGEYRLKEAAVWKQSGTHYGALDSVDRQLGKLLHDFCESFTNLLQKQDLNLSPVYRLDHLVEI